MGREELTSLAANTSGHSLNLSFLVYKMDLV